MERVQGRVSRCAARLLRRTCSSRAATTDSSCNKTRRDRCSSGGSSAATKSSSIAQYGAVGAVFHSTVYCCSLATVYGAISCGVDVQALTGSLPEATRSAGTLAIAWGCTALTGPARGVVTVLATPKLTKMWGARR